MTTSAIWEGQQIPIGYEAQHARSVPSQSLADSSYCALTSDNFGLCLARTDVTLIQVQ